MSAETTPAPRVCRGCGCTDEDGCLMSVARTAPGYLVYHACWWVEEDLCSACFLGERESGPQMDHRLVLDGTGADDAAPAGDDTTERTGADGEA